jgi:hypothetical protein
MARRRRVRNMPRFDVEFSQRMSVMLEVEAETAEAAAEAVNRRDFVLPPRDLWSANKDGLIQVFADGERVHEIEF